MQKILRRVFCVFILLLVAVSVPGVHAQSAPYVIRSTTPMGSELKDHLDAWLAVDAPGDALYYIVTYWKVKNGITKVSLAGVNLSGPDEPWSFEESESTVWIGSVTGAPDGGGG